MATELAKAYVQIVPSAEGIEGKIEDALSGSAGSAGEASGENFVKKMAKAVVGSAVIAKIGQGISASISEGADLQQSIGGIETLYKESSDTMIAYADQAFKTAGLSANDYMETATSFSASLLQSLGGDTAKAAEAANSAIIDMADNSNKMGTSMESIQLAYQGFAKQNYTMLDNLKLGYGGTKSEMERLLKDAQEITGVEYDIDSLSDVYDAIHVIQGELDITGTTSKEAASTFKGSAAAMKAAFSNVLGNLSLGRDIGPSLNALAKTVSTFLFGNLIPMIMNILRTLPGALMSFLQTMAAELAPMGRQLLDSLLRGLADIPELISKAGEMITGLIDGFTAALPMLLTAGKSILTGVGNGIINAIPSLISSAGKIITSVITTIQSALPNILQTGWEIISNIGSGIVNNLPSIVTSIEGMLTSIYDAITNEEAVAALLDKGSEIIDNIIDGITNAAPTVATAATDFFTWWINAVGTYLPTMLLMGKNILSKIISGIGEKLPDVITAAWDILSAIINKIAENLPAMMAEGRAILTNIVNGIAELLPNVASAAWDIMSTIVGKIVEGLPGILAIGFSILKNVAAGIIENLPTIASAAWDMLVAIVTKIVENLPAFLSQGAALLKQIAQGITDTQATVVSAIWNMLAALLAKIFAALPTFLANGKTIVTKIAAGIKAKVADAKTAIGTVMNGIKDKITNMGETIKGWGKSIVNKIKDGIINAPLALGSLGTKIYNAIKNALSGFSFSSLGSSIISGLKGGINSAIGGAVESAKNAVSSIYNAARSALKINSPSKLFRDGVGAPIAEGIIVGIDDNLEPTFIQKDINAVLTAAQDTVHNPVASGRRDDTTAIAAAVRSGMESAKIKTTITEKSFRRGLQGMGVSFA